jgi:hypothetical protein
MDENPLKNLLKTAQIHFYLLNIGIAKTSQKRGGEVSCKTKVETSYTLF